METLTIFRSHMNAAEALLKVYRLLAPPVSPTAAADQTMLPKLRELLRCSADEPIVLLLNDYFLGLARGRAEVTHRFVEPPSLALLLRQATVSACTAMDVFLPALLDAYLPARVEIRQRNFLSTKAEVRDLMRDFRLKLEQLPALLEEDDGRERWNTLARLILDHCREKTLSNVAGVTAVMLLLGVKDPWRKIGEQAGMSESALRDQIQALVKRRNDIVHRGDRPVGQPEADPQPITYTWASAHVNAAHAVVSASDELAAEALATLRAEAGVTANGAGAPLAVG